MKPMLALVQRIKQPQRGHESITGFAPRPMLSVEVFPRTQRGVFQALAKVKSWKARFVLVNTHFTDSQALIEHCNQQIAKGKSFDLPGGGS